MVRPAIFIILMGILFYFWGRQTQVDHQAETNSNPPDNLMEASEELTSAREELTEEQPETIEVIVGHKQK